MGAGRLFQCAVEVTESPSSVRPQSSAKKYTISAGDKAEALHTHLTDENLTVNPLAGDGTVVLDLAHYDYFTSTPRKEGIVDAVKRIAAQKELGA